jgi:hypothetical protein
MIILEHGRSLSNIINHIIKFILPFIAVCCYERERVDAIVGIGGN